MERITGREAVAKLANAILGKGERTTGEEAVLELLFKMSEGDDAGRRSMRVCRRQRRVARSA